ncbi:MAG: aldose 1-epimerase family protein [Prevotella sp.]|nr:aldose 1-epimerase family protein [Prevotella sp.]
MIELRNEQISIVVAEKGAELQSIKDVEEKEYLWQGDPKYWPRRSPILFPLVCSVENDTYRVDGKEYHLPRHGFARDKEFTVIRQGEDRVTLALHESDETLKVYPFCFNLAVTYRLEGNTIHVIWHVENTDKRDIHFQIGGHPAFNVPGMKDGDQLQGCITLDRKEPLVALKSYADGSHDMEDVPVEAEYGVLEFNNHFFRNDSVKIHNSQVRQAILLDEDDQPAVTVNFRTPVIAFWSPFGKQAPFVCIEPWYGIGDPRGYDGEFRDKPLMNHLQPGASFMSEYTIQIG